MFVPDYRNIYHLQQSLILYLYFLDFWSLSRNLNTEYLNFWTPSNTCPSDYILITNLMHQLLFIHKIIFSSTCFEPQVLIFRRIQLYTCSIWYCHSLWEFLVACQYTAWVRTDCRGKVAGGCLKTPTSNLPLTVSSHSSCVPTSHQELS